MAKLACTLDQFHEILKKNNWNRRKTARELGISWRTTYTKIGQLRQAGMDIQQSEYDVDRIGYIAKEAIAAHGAAPDGYHVKGVSTLYDVEGKVKSQWVKTSRDAEERTEALLEAVRSAFANSERIPVISPPADTDAKIMTVYPIGDAHFGMHAWGEEAGDDFDLKIAETDLVNAVRRLIKSAPRSEEALIVNVGDYFHTNDGSNRTPKSGNILDVDSRFAKIIRVGVRALRTCIDLALRRHQKVRIISTGGNHDPASSVALTVALSMFYENNPRVEFDQSPAPFIYHEFGKNLIGVTHGDTVKLTELGSIMAADCPEAWGRTKYRYWYTGHVHHDRMVEGREWTAESFRTLAARDGFATRSGYRSGRDMHAIALHEQWGEIERHRVDIAQLREMR